MRSYRPRSMGGSSAPRPTRGARGFCPPIVARGFSRASSYNQLLYSPMFVSAIIAAGGRSVRFGGAHPKQLVAVGGRTLLERTVSLFLTHPRVDEVIVALPVEL